MLNEKCSFWDPATCQWKFLALGNGRPVNKVTASCGGKDCCPDHVLCAFEYRSWHNAGRTLDMYLMLIWVSLVARLLSIGRTWELTLQNITESVDQGGVFFFYIKSLESSEKSGELGNIGKYIERSLHFLCQSLDEFSRCFRFCKPNIEYWVGKQALVRLGVLAGISLKGLVP